jgi:hypothetical protein
MSRNTEMAHVEKHFMASEFVRDVVIGMADGLTVPFALAAGLSGTLSSSTLVVVAGLAEIAAGSIAMGLGGYLAARTERDHYLAELERERREIIELPHREREEVAEILSGWGMEDKEVKKEDLWERSLSRAPGKLPWWEGWPRAWLIWSPVGSLDRAISDVESKNNQGSARHGRALIILRVFSPPVLTGSSVPEAFPPSGCHRSG